MRFTACLTATNSLFSLPSTLDLRYSPSKEFSVLFRESCSTSLFLFSSIWEMASLDRVASSLMEFTCLTLKSDSFGIFFLSSLSPVSSCLMASISFSFCQRQSRNWLIEVFSKEICCFSSCFIEQSHQSLSSLSCCPKYSMTRFSEFARNLSSLATSFVPFLLLLGQMAESLAGWGVTLGVLVSSLKESNLEVSRTGSCKSRLFLDSGLSLRLVRVLTSKGWWRFLAVNWKTAPRGSFGGRGWNLKRLQPELRLEWLLASESLSESAESLRAWWLSFQYLAVGFLFIFSEYSATSGTYRNSDTIQFIT